MHEVKVATCFSTNIQCSHLQTAFVPGVLLWKELVADNCSTNASWAMFCSCMLKSSFQGNCCVFPFYFKAKTDILQPRSQRILFISFWLIKYSWWPHENNQPVWPAMVKYIETVMRQKQHVLLPGCPALPWLPFLSLLLSPSLPPSLFCDPLFCLGIFSLCSFS